MRATPQKDCYWGGLRSNSGTPKTTKRSCRKASLYEVQRFTATLLRGFTPVTFAHFSHTLLSLTHIHQPTRNKIKIPSSISLTCTQMWECKWETDDGASASTMYWACSVWAPAVFMDISHPSTAQWNMYLHPPPFKSHLLQGLWVPERGGV